MVTYTLITKKDPRINSSHSGVHSRIHDLLADKLLTNVLGSCNVCVPGGWRSCIFYLIYYNKYIFLSLNFISITQGLTSYYVIVFFTCFQRH